MQMEKVSEKRGYFFRGTFISVCFREMTSLLMVLRYEESCRIIVVPVLKSTRLEIGAVG